MIYIQGVNYMHWWYIYDIGVLSLHSLQSYCLLCFLIF